MNESARVHGFPPIAHPDARVLILGSMPGEASLSAQQYYAHPRNAFWPILGELLGFDPLAPYAIRRQALLDARIAVWDVLASCVRPGSADSDIDSGSIIVNDFEAFFRQHADIQAVYCNGSKAQALFRRHGLTGVPQQTPCICLPSTSPAHAARSLTDKLNAWRVVLTPLSQSATRRRRRPSPECPS